MCFGIVRWLGRVSLSTAALAALLSGPATGQDTPKQDETSQPPATLQADGPAGGVGLSSADKSPADLQPTPAADPTAAAASASKDAATAGSPTPAKEAPLVPVPDPAASVPPAVEAASFKGVTPGVTTQKELEQAWGAPKEIRKQNGTLIQLYQVEPFEQVEVSSRANRVASIVIRLDRSFPADAVAQQLELTNVRPVLVSNELGQILGQAYPERGVLFAFEPSKETGKVSMQVAQIILEPISAEPFVLRAETNLDSQFELSLNDIKEALKLQPGNARAYWLRSRLLMAMGDYDQALAASGKAVGLEPENARYRVTQAQVLGLLGRLDEATEAAQKAIETSARRPHVKARALCLLGDLAASEPRPDYRKAIQFHTQAVKEADPLAASPHPAIRLAAKEVLLDAHLGAAHDIAWGDWKQKPVAVTKWLSQAEAFAEDLIKSEGANQDLRFRVSTRALATYVGMRGELDPSKWANMAIRTGKQLLASTDDRFRKAQLRWDLGMALYDALQTYQMRNEHDSALKYGELAIEYLEQGDQRKQSATTGYLLGRLYFRLGAIHAIGHKNHHAAITWFDKAVPLLEKPIPKEAAADLGRHGETFVSMGVSYWAAEQREKAVELTQRGAELMEQAVELGSLDKSALAVPYANLASMHRQLGRKEKAEQFEERTAKLKKTRVR